MKLLPLHLAAAACLAGSVLAADPTDDARKKEEIRALILADASSKPATPAAKPADDTRTAQKDQPAAIPAEPAPDADAAATPKPEEPATMLPQVEVNKSRITNIDIAIAAQDQAIAREKANTKPTKLDDTLNNSKVAKALAIFGGSSSEERSGIAQERIRIMEEEKELLESLRLARTKEEKAELQRELDDLRAQRRELDLAPK